jgi:hypothetical protein
MDTVTVTLFAHKDRSELRVVGHIKTRTKIQLLHTVAYVNWRFRNFGDRSVPLMERFRAQMPQYRNNISYQVKGTCKKTARPMF